MWSISLSVTQESEVLEVTVHYDVRHECYVCGMARVRISTTVDDELLAAARSLMGGTPDSVVVDRALTALIERIRDTEIDDEYSVYEDRPLTEPDAWGDLDSFRTAAGSS